MKKEDWKIFQQCKWALSLSLLVCLFLSTAIYFLSCFFLSLCLFSFAHALEIWVVIVHSAVTKNTELASACRCSCGCFLLAVTVPLGWVSFLLTHTISFRFSELIPYKLCTTWRGCLGDGLCRWLGRSDLHGSHVKMLPVGLLFPVAERDPSYLHPIYPLSLPEDTCTLWNVKEIKLCEKKLSAPFLAFPPVVGDLKEH